MPVPGVLHWGLQTHYHLDARLAPERRPGDGWPQHRQADLPPTPTPVSLRPVEILTGHLVSSGSLAKGVFVTSCLLLKNQF